MALCALAILLALQVVGVVSGSVLRHLLQTAPLWIVVGLGLRSSRWTRWAAFPAFAFWLALMAVVWGYLLGWTRIISGTFSTTEVAMTGVTGAAAAIGLVAAFRDHRYRTPLVAASATAAGVLLLQLLVFVLSFRPGIAHDVPRSGARRSPAASDDQRSSSSLAAARTASGVRSRRQR
jgi:uncharacterized membrane protein